MLDNPCPSPDLTSAESLRHEALRAYGVAGTCPVTSRARTNLLAEAQVLATLALSAKPPARHRRTAAEARTEVAA